MRRALLLILVSLFLLGTPTARAATTLTININSGSPSPNPANIVAGDSVKWHNADSVDHIVHIGAQEVYVPAEGDSEVEGPFDAGTYDYTVKDGLDTVGSGEIVAEEAATTTTSSTTTTTKPTTTSSTTTRSSSTTTTSTSTTTTLFSSASAPITIQDKGGSGGGSSALPLILGALVIIAGFAGLAYWLWLRSSEPYEDDGPDWTEEPPPTVQGPRL